MNNFSYNLNIPQVYLVPKNFHCGTTCSDPNSSRFCCVFSSRGSDSALTDIGADELSIRNDDKFENMYKKCLEQKTNSTKQNKNKIKISKYCQPIQIVCKSRQPERIRQFKLFSSSKLDNFNKTKWITKWCPTDFYERPKRVFKRSSSVVVVYGDPRLEKYFIQNDNNITGASRRDQSECLGPLNIAYEVTSQTNDTLQLRSFIDLANDKSLIQLIKYSENAQEWEELVKLMESQLDENIKQVKINIELNKKKTANRVNSLVKMRKNVQK